MFGDLRCVVRHANFIVKKLTPDIAQQLQQVRRVCEKIAAPVQVTDVLSQRPQHALEIPRTVVVVRLLRHCPQLKVCPITASSALAPELCPLTSDL